MQKWKLSEIVLLGFLAFLFGAVFMLAGYLYTGLEILLTPAGLSPFANEILFGMWTMAAPVAGILIQKPGSSILGEVFASVAEMLYGSYFGAGVILSGLLQGSGTELGFLLTRYKRYDTISLIYGALGTTIISFFYEFFKFGYGSYGIIMVVSLLIVRFLSVMFFGVILVKQTMKLYEVFKKSEV